ncbi:MAG TPA: hypothetical protein PKA38_03420 [Candidatus Levybacteria bacterium]|nr:hypothetical protein [Candidatus Levybacteria bacterium]
MERNIERAVMKARAQAEHEAVVSRGSKELLLAWQDREKWITRILQKGKNKRHLETVNARDDVAQERLSIINSITDLNFGANSAWKLSSVRDGKHIDIEMIDKDGKKLYSVKVEGKSPSDHEFSRLAKLYSNAVDEIQGILKIQEASGESSRRPQEELRSDSGRAKSEDLLGHFKVLGLKPNDFEGLNEYEIASMINAKYRLAARKEHPDMQSGDSHKMTKINNARDALFNAYKTRMHDKK